MKNKMKKIKKWVCTLSPVYNMHETLTVIELYGVYTLCTRVTIGLQLF